MKRPLWLAALVLILLLASRAPVQASPWAGVDETVIEKVAEAAGRPARDSLINTDQGDILLFVFLLAGIAGGFAAGYHFRALFPPRGRNEWRGKIRRGSAMQGAAPLGGKGE